MRRVLCVVLITAAQAAGGSGASTRYASSVAAGTPAPRGVSSMVEQRTFNPASLSAVLTCKDPDHRRAQALKSDALIFDALAGVNTGLLDVLRVVQLEHGSDHP